MGRNRRTKRLAEVVADVARDIEWRNQEICRRFVGREVFHNLSNTMQMFQEQKIDEYLEAFGGYDYEEAARAEGWEEVPEDDDDADGATYRIQNEDHDVDAVLRGESDELPFKYSSVDSWESLCQNEDIDASDYQREVMEHWAVSEFLGRKLKEKGHIVADILDFHVWGRECSGQAIYADNVIEEIARDQEILVGQKYEWKD